jgi:hypothetical protein
VPFPLVRRFDRIFRNEGVRGSNPLSSTESPGQGEFGEFVRSLDSPSCDLTPHSYVVLKHLAGSEVLSHDGRDGRVFEGLGEAPLWD